MEESHSIRQVRHVHHAKKPGYFRGLHQPVVAKYTEVKGARKSQVFHARLNQPHFLDGQTSLRDHFPDTSNRVHAVLRRELIIRKAPSRPGASAVIIVASDCPKEGSS